jgi:predicted Holliday junction resolvase-like endonuclease
LLTILQSKGEFVMQDIPVGLIVVLPLVAIALLAIALIYLFQQLRKSQTKVENLVKGYEIQLRDIQVKHQREIEQARKQSVETSRRTIKGKIAEQLAPILAGFPYLPSDSHFIGDPVDYIVFNGYTEFKDCHSSSDNLELVLIDIKHNQAQLSAGQKQIAKAIEAGKVRFETIRISDEGTIKAQPWDSPKKGEPTMREELKPIEMFSSVQIVPPNSAIQPSEKHNNAFKNWYAFLQKFPNAYEPWSEVDDNLLKEKYISGMKVNELAPLLKRNPGKIRSRLKEKGLLLKKSLRKRRPAQRTPDLE